ncbi:MAG: hypothetical protein L6V93_13460 [Clostridiales bacterium]|nr:MAG: hypothetical protein L6V93_13460 [Clostridiales bacterium]
MLKIRARNAAEKAKVKRACTVEVNIPAGIDTNETVSFRGLGNHGFNGGPKGDLLCNGRCKNATICLCETARRCSAKIPITFVQAALGAEIDVPTLNGKVKQTIPEGTQKRHALLPLKAQEYPTCARA